MKKEIYLIRHAQSEFNERGIFQGRLDSDLTPLGFVQARLVARSFLGKGIELIVTSPQRRAYKTALTMGDILGLEVKVDERLREMSFGILEGKDFWQLFEEEREMMTRWLRNPVEHPLPTQEDMMEFERRVRSFIEDLKEMNFKRIAIVGHGGTLHAVVCLTLGLGLENLWNIHMDNTGVTLLEYEKGEFRLAFLNSLCHLREMG